jgi:hypothetical protein
MSVYTFADARQQFELLFDEAKANKEVIIQRPNGDRFLLRLVTSNELKQALPDLGINLSRQEIVEYIREVRER